MRFDVVIVGAGAVGLSVARRMADSRMTVALIEAGSPQTPAASTEIHFTKTPHDGVLNGRAAGPGGTTQLWGGQLWAWEDYEFRAREYVNSPSWPFGRADLQPYYAAFLEQLAVNHPMCHILLGQARGLSPVSDEFAYRKESAWLPWRKRNFWNVFRDQLQARENVTILLGREVVGVQHRRGEIELTTSDSERGRQRIRTKRLFIAAGTIGNVRLLQQHELTSSPLVGRGFMDHVSGTYATFDVTDRSLFARHAAARYAHGSLFTERLVMAPLWAQRHRVLNAYAHWDIQVPTDSIYTVVRESLRSVQRRQVPHARGLVGSSRNVPREAAHAGYALGVLHRRPVPLGATVKLQIEVEQPPRENSRINWDVTADGPVEVEWRIGSEEETAFKKFGAAVLNNIDATALGIRLREVSSEPQFRDTFHMMGGTPLGADSTTSVVDEVLSMHEHADIKVLGASVFPTGGVANPTMTATSVALRAVGLEDL